MNRWGDGVGHFTDSKWADFAREVMSGEEKKAMQSHLDDGCKKCARILGTWKRLHEAARREAAYEPPDSIVRTVKGMGAIYGLGKGRPIKPSIAELLFDSLRNPMPAGVRSTAGSARQLLYGVGPYRLDLRIQPEEGSDKVALMGQILSSSDPEQPIGVISMSLRKGNKVLAESMTNRFGEFQLEFDPEGSLQLHAALPHGESIQVPLVDTEVEGSKKVSESTDSIGLRRIRRNARKGTRKKS